MSCPSIPPGCYLIGGTSEGPPQLAGIIADADQLAGRPLGFLNPAIYSIGNSGDYHESFHDIFGSNAFAGVRGFKATPGWDHSTGWGPRKLRHSIILRFFNAVAAGAIECLEPWGVVTSFHSHCS